MAAIGTLINFETIYKIIKTMNNVLTLHQTTFLDPQKLKASVDDKLETGTNEPNFFNPFPNKPCFLHVYKIFENTEGKRRS